MEQESVLITGGSGLIGRYLTSVLLSEGYKVSHLSRNANHFGKVRVFRWDHEKEIIDPGIFEEVDLPGTDFPGNACWLWEKQLIFLLLMESGQ